MAGEDASENYIKVDLARPVPPEGQARLLILKTYKDAKSYYRENETIVFNRSLSIPRNSVVLPAGYELVACNVPSQVLSQPDGRISISFMNDTGAAAPLVVKGRLGARTGAAAAPPAPSRRRAGNLLLRERPSRSAFRNARIRTAILFTSSSSQKHTHSACITTTRNREPAQTNTSMLFAPAVKCPNHQPTCSIQAKS